MATDASAARAREPIDELFLRRAARLGAAGGRRLEPGDPRPETLLALFDAMAQSRHLDFAARWLQAQGCGYYTIASAGHEANAALGLVSRVSDPALLHYRSGAFYAARAARRPEASGTATDDAGDPIRDVLLGLVAAEAEPMSGGRYKVFGHRALHILPQTSTIASHLPRALGLAFALDSARRRDASSPWPADAIVVCSFGDASVNHSTAQGALNAAAYLAHRGVPAPILFVCEDNGIGISVPTPPGWVEQALGRFPRLPYTMTDGMDAIRLLADVERVVDDVRARRRPAILHLKAVRLMGHAGSDVETAYRSTAQIAADRDRDPLLAAAACLVELRLADAAAVIERYESMRDRVMGEAAAVQDEPRHRSRESVMRPLAWPTAGDQRPAASAVRPAAPPSDRDARWQGKPPETLGPLTLAQSINSALSDVLATHPDAAVFGQDVALKGGVYGVTRGLQRHFGTRRVFDTLLDEQTLLGVALGIALAGGLPIPEIQYLAYLHNAEDQIRGEAATLRFFSAGQYQNGMVVRVPGLAYQQGFGGHFHNDNSLAVLRDIPGVVVCVPSHPADAPDLLRACVALAEGDGRVCVFVEPIALYHRRDLHDEGDGGWTSRYRAPDDDRSARALGAIRNHEDGDDILLVTFGNGVPMSLRAARRLRASGVSPAVVDLTWLAPLPAVELAEEASRYDRILVVDETRASGGVSESVLTALADSGYGGRAARVASADSFIPLGPAAAHVLLGEQDVVDAALRLLDLSDA